MDSSVLRVGGHYRKRDPESKRATAGRPGTSERGTMTNEDENADMWTDEQMTRGETELPSDWRDQPVDPDLEENLGYEMIAWEKINVVDNPDQVIFLPNSEDQLRDDAFIVSNKDSVCDLTDKR